MLDFPPIRDYPREWFIEGDLWHLKFSSKLSKQGIDGLTDPSNYTVTISYGMSKANTFATFIHEMLHAMEFSYGYELPYKDSFSYEDFHWHIYKLEHHFTWFIKENFDSFVFLFCGPKR